MRWYELRKFTGGNWGIQNQGTFGPADGMYRWMGAGAMDKSGDLAIGYSIGTAQRRTTRASRTPDVSSPIRRTS